jgi:transcriptional regulator with XRE-family HTH domain
MQDEAKRRMAGLRIKEARKAARLSQQALADRLSLPQSVISDWERGELQSWRDHLDRLAATLGKPTSYFATPSDNNGGVNTLSVREIPVVGDVQGGNFRMIVEVPPDRRTTVAVAVEEYRAYPAAELRALKVVGPSVNELYPDGTTVIVVPASVTDVRHGDHVVVFLRQGELCEATIKEARFEAGRWVLYPRSNHPDHQTAIYLDTNPDDQDGPEVAYVVVGSQTTRERPPPAIPFPLRR